MENIVKEAIKQSWNSFQFENHTSSENGHPAHDHGWKEGAEWILTELVINKKISEKDLNKYMKMID